MGLRMLPVADTAMAQQVADLAAQTAAASAKADNARQMVLNRDPTLASLQQAAAQLPVSTAAADQAHAALGARIDALLAQVNAIKGANNLTAGARSVGALLLNASTTLTVPLVSTMPSATYSVKAVHTGLINLTDATLEITGQTTTTVSVKVTAKVATVAGTLLVLAW